MEHLVWSSYHEHPPLFCFYDLLKTKPNPPGNIWAKSSIGIMNHPLQGHRCSHKVFVTLMKTSYHNAREEKIMFALFFSELLLETD